jgi:hypothetical protein
MNNHKLDIIQSEHGITADVSSMIEQTRESITRLEKSPRLFHPVPTLACIGLAIILKNVLFY